MMEDLRADWSRYAADASRDGHRPRASTILREFGFQALVVYRLGRWLARLSRVPRVLASPGWLLYAIGALFVRTGYDIRIELSADIGPGFLIGHFGGIRIAGCRIGPGCFVGQQTEIAPAGAGLGGPSVGSQVWIGAHARLIGPVQVGDRASIAAGARVVADVPATSLVAGDPARVVRRDFDNRGIL